MENQNQDQNVDAKRLVFTFNKLAGINPENFTVTQKTNWLKSAIHLINSSGMEISDLVRFMKWAVQENIHENPKFSSVTYINSAKDKFATFINHSESLLGIYQRRNITLAKVATAVRKKKNGTSTPMPLNEAEWLMKGPGVNQPPSGWVSARQKLEAAKESWYGASWEDEPDPDIHWEDIFNESQKNQSNRKVWTDND